MIKTLFDPRKKYCYAVYLRMSSDRQNPRSPDQQLAMIREQLARAGYSWVEVKIYRDDGISGRLNKKRLAFQQMLSDIRTGKIKVDLILVDTKNRFGRNETIPIIRAELQKLGVLILDAHRGFMDPTSLAGRTIASVDEILSVEENSIKASNVRRGKRDTALQGYWPGGPPPFGFDLAHTLFEAGKYVRKRSKLVIDESLRWIVVLMFSLVKEQHLGQARVTRHLNNHPDVKNLGLTFLDPTVGRMLANPIYSGILRWDDRACDIVDDRRVSVRKPDEEVLLVPDFCEAIVSPADFAEVTKLREVRGEAMREIRRTKKSSKLLQAVAPGQTLLYPLSGLVRCGECDRSMAPTSSKPFTAKDGSVRRYVSYVCPARASGICDNVARVNEAWLRETVFKQLLERLTLTESQVDEAMLRELTAAVETELTKRQASGSSVDGLKAELAELQKAKRGYMQTLGVPDLEDDDRAEILASMKTIKERAAHIEASIAEREAILDRRHQLVDVERIQANLKQLPELLGGDNATRCNVELALHIDSIRCFKDRRMLLRICKLGGVIEAIEFLRDPTLESKSRDGKSQPRLRAKMDLTSFEAAEALEEAMHFASDPFRFEGVPDQWFWVDQFQIPDYASWAKLNAQAVWQYWQEQGRCSIAELVAHFGKSAPTIRKALKLAAEEPDLPAQAG